MVRAGVCLLTLVSGCAHVVVDDDGPPVSHAAPVAAEPAANDDGRDFAVRVDAPARCEQAARALLPTAPDQAWRALWGCVCDGHFTALRSLLNGAWDPQLRTRRDAPMLIARVIAERGGDVEGDLRLVHERRIPLFGLNQALARPDRLRGAVVIVRARVSPGGLLDETRLVSQSWEQPLGPIERETTDAAPPFGADTSRLWVERRSYNLDVATGTRTIASVDDPFIEPGDPVVVLGRFEGLRDGDAWPVVTVLDHYRPSATVAY